MSLSFYVEGAVKRPKKSRQVVAGLVVRRPDGKILVIKRTDGRWDLPKGHRDPGESAFDAARREAREETGLRPSVERKQRVSFVKGGGKKLHFYPAVVGKRARVRLDPAEHRKFRWVSRDTAVKLLKKHRELAKAVARLAEDSPEGRTPEGLFVMDSVTEARGRGYDFFRPRSSRKKAQKFVIKSVSLVREGTYKYWVDLGLDGEAAITTYPPRVAGEPDDVVVTQRGEPWPEGTVRSYITAAHRKKLARAKKKAKLTEATVAAAIGPVLGLTRTPLAMLRRQPLRSVAGACRCPVCGHGMDEGKACCRSCDGGGKCRGKKRISEIVEPQDVPDCKPLEPPDQDCTRTAAWNKAIRRQMLKQKAKRRLGL